VSFVIQAGIAPVSNKRGRRPTDFPLGDMDVGHSFLIECDINEKKVVESWRRKLLVARKRFVEAGADESVKFMTAIVNDEHGTGLRVWRTA